MIVQITATATSISAWVLFVPAHGFKHSALYLAHSGIDTVLCSRKGLWGHVSDCLRTKHLFIPAVLNICSCKPAYLLLQCVTMVMQERKQHSSLLYSCTQTWRAPHNGAEDKGNHGVKLRRFLDSSSLHMEVSVHRMRHVKPLLTLYHLCVSVCANAYWLWYTSVHSEWTCMWICECCVVQQSTLSALHNQTGLNYCVFKAQWKHQALFYLPRTGSSPRVQDKTAAAEMKMNINSFSETGLWRFIL